MSDDYDPIVEILQLAARRGFEIMRQREQQSRGDPAPTYVKVESTGDTMNKQKIFDTIDSAVQALKGLKKAIAEGNKRVIDIELQTIQQELQNVREMVEKG